jgi:undecaprenyl-diphosphatase
MLFPLLFLFLSLTLPAEESMQPPPLRTLSPFQAVIFGIVEGVTEFLPISSTGHLLLTNRILKISHSPESEQAMDTYTIVIQMGAILAVAWLYKNYLFRMLMGLMGRDQDGRNLLRNLILAFLPAALVGVLFVHLIKTHLFGLWPVTFAWFAGGLALLIWSKDPEGESEDVACALGSMTWRQAILIGLIQVVAMWPGTSRSLVTILGGKWVGLSLNNAVAFSFLLGLITLSASTLYDLALNGAQMITSLGLSSVLIGMFAAYGSAWMAVRGLVSYLKRHGLGLFGGYRIGIACITALLLLSGIISP